MDRVATASALRILAGHLTGRAGGNADVELLYAAMRSSGEVVAEPYSTRALLRGGWDIVHLSWPEWAIRRDLGPAVAAADAARVLAQLRLAKARGTRIVWSAHNIRPHESHNYGVVDAFVKAFSLLADQVICTSQALLDEFLREYPGIRTADCRVIPQGHYRGVYPDDGLTMKQARDALDLPQDATILLSLGLARRYKNLLPLLRCYREMADERQDVFLLIAGEALDPEYARQLQYEAAELKTARLDLHYIPDNRLQYYLKAADRLAIPTSLPTNSGSAILALSYGCPILAPHRAGFIELREAMGPQWVQTYEAGLRAQVLRDAFAAKRLEGSPAFEANYEWSTAGAAHVRAFQELVSRWCN
jgi:glycosyltransferase involved in cell wall biosynthesis